jgi:hypothetical protein
MTIKTICADGTVEVFNTQEYRISKAKDFHPLLCSVEVYDNGRRIFRRRRLFSWWYKTFTFWHPEVQNQLRKLSAEAETKKQ